MNIWRSGWRDWWDPKQRRRFDDAHFLGPPLPAKKKLWILNEDSSGQVRLVIIDPTKNNKHHEPMVLDPLLQLGKVAKWEVYRDSLLRRVSPVQLALADNILICPTHAGAIFGVDIDKRNIAWNFSYRKPAKAVRKARILNPDPRNGLDLAWRYPAPHLAGGKLVFTAADDSRVHCLQVNDGKPLWTTKKDGDLYLAGVFGDKVLLVGGKECRALDLADGKEAWRIKTGVPSGMGAADGGIYYLPLRKGEKGKAEVCVIDIAAGKIAQRLPTPDNEPLGNLVFHENLLVSQSATVIMAFTRKR